eukprot:1679514-Prymnesium_polylepis.2
MARGQPILSSDLGVGDAGLARRGGGSRPACSLVVARRCVLSAPAAAPSGGAGSCRAAPPGACASDSPAESGGDSSDAHASLSVPAPPAALLALPAPRRSARPLVPSVRPSV